MAVAENTKTSTQPKSAPEERIFAASQWRLMWWRFRKHKMGVASLVILIAFYALALGADFIAYAPAATDARRSLVPPQTIYLFDEGNFAPFVFGIKGWRDQATFKRNYALDPTRKLHLQLFARGYEYNFLGLLRSDFHLIGVREGKAEESLFIFGTDAVGRDLFSRLLLATRTSLSIGLVGVTLSLVLGVLLGGASGYFGGWTDTIIQRIIEILRSIPTVPLWMGLAAALPRSWSVLQVYFAITLIISLIGWTELARVVRGRFLSLRNEDYVVAAELYGCSRARIVFKHLLPSFLSHIIAATTLAIPAMIISETSLSFLGLGLRAPAVSWGVLLQDAQNIQSIINAPWLLIPVVPVILAILAFNFLGDGLRDAADPYNQ